MKNKTANVTAQRANAARGGDSKKPIDAARRRHRELLLGLTRAGMPMAPDSPETIAELNRALERGDRESAEDET